MVLSTAWPMWSWPVTFRTKNAAEFDINTYEIKLNGEAEGVVGNIFYSNVLAAGAALCTGTRCALRWST